MQMHIFIRIIDTVLSGKVITSKAFTVIIFENCVLLLCKLCTAIVCK